MEPNIKELLNYEELSKEKKEKATKAIEECLIIFTGAVLRIEKIIDNLLNELYEEENE